MTALYDPRQAPADTGALGGKACNLYRLGQRHRVPAWVAVPAPIFTDCLATQGLDRAIADELASLTADNAGAVAGRIQALILAMALPGHLRDDLAAMIGATFAADYVSVRSSAVDEDGADYSFAGIHESFLYVRGAVSVAEHVRRVWASGYQERALVYRLDHALPLHPVRMAVVIQRMVDAQTSGVVFTADPATGNPHRMIISALYGLGEGLVSAGLAADHIAYDKPSGACRVSLANKETRYGLDTDAQGGIREYPVAHDARETGALTPALTQELAAAAIAIEREYGRPQDIEFCFDVAGQLYILQTRDITTVHEYGPAAGNRQVWDNSNIIESYSGVTSPMTFSFIRHAYAVVYHCFSQVMGIPRKTIEQNQGVYHNMLGLFHGQVYYNLPNWYRLVQQFPGYAYNKAFMESMMGVKHVTDSDAARAVPVSAWRRYAVELPRLFGLAGRMLFRFMSLHRLVPAFNRHFDHYYGAWAALDFEDLPPHELMQIYQDMETHLLRNWKVPIINDFYVMVFYGTLKACCKSWCADEHGTLQNNLICGEGDIESTVPTRILMRLAAEIKQNPALKTLFLESGPQDLLEAIPRRDDTTAIAAALDQYLEDYGFRCMNELKLEEPSLHETPEFIYQMLINYVRMDAALLDVSAMDARERAIRSEAEQRAFTGLSRWKALLLRFMLKHARRGVKNRENMRFARTKIYGLLRQLLLAAGASLVREGILDDPDDVFSLAIDELWDYVKGTAVSTDLRGLAALRKVEFDAYRAADTGPDDHFETFGMAYHRNRFRNHERETTSEAEPGALKGIGCSPGIVSGVARVVHSPRDDVNLNGEILVAARTDPGWVPLYPSVSGILIERGSILSHSAIVAREMGIPAIVGIPRLLEQVKDGDAVQMDASTGEVTVAAQSPGVP